MAATATSGWPPHYYLFLDGSAQNVDLRNARRELPHPPTVEVLALPIPTGRYLAHLEARQQGMTLLLSLINVRAQVFAALCISMTPRTACRAFMVVPSVFWLAGRGNPVGRLSLSVREKRQHEITHARPTTRSRTFFLSAPSKSWSSVGSSRHRGSSQEQPNLKPSPMKQMTTTVAGWASHSNKSHERRHRWRQGQIDLDTRTGG